MSGCAKTIRARHQHMSQTPAKIEEIKHQKEQKTGVLSGCLVFIVVPQFQLMESSDSRPLPLLG
jgi:hypothetical protein